MDKKRSYRCTLCSWEGTSIQKFIVHLNAKHKREALPQQVLSEWKVEQCPKCFFYAQNLKKHRKKLCAPVGPPPKPCEPARPSLAATPVVARPNSLEDQDLKQNPLSVRAQIVPNVGVQLRPPHPEPQLQSDDQVDAVMADREAYKHMPYVPRLWRTVPHHLWGLWTDLCRPKFRAITVAATARDRESLDKAILELLQIPLRALRRQRGGRNKKTHKTLERQMRDATLSDAVPEIKDQKANDSEDASLRKIQKAASLVYDGHIRRAVKGLLQDPIPTLTDGSRAELRALHPKGPTNLPPRPRNSARTLNIDKDSLRDIISRDLANGAAPGRSGWSGDMIRAVAQDEECMDGISALTLAILNGELEGKAKTALLASILIGLKKPGGGTRPIAIGETFYKLAAVYAIKTVEEAAREALGPTQFAMAPGGSEAAVLYLRTAIAQHPTWCVLACDIKNAFNSRDRAAILKKLYETPSLEPLWRISHWAYGAPSDLLVTDGGKLTEIIPSAQGVRQGDALSSLLFALSMVQIYRDTAERSGTRTIAVQDDVYFLGPEHSAEKAWEVFSELTAAGTGLTVNSQKSSILVPTTGVDLQKFTALGIKPSNSCISALGTILTRNMSTLKRWLKVEVVKTHDTLFSSLADKRLPTQVAFQLLRMCAIPLVLYWMRTSPPLASKDLAVDFDARVQQCAASILNIQNASSLAQKQLFLPVKMGGFGLRAMVLLADAAFVSALAQAIQYMDFMHQPTPTDSIKVPLEEALERINSQQHEVPLPAYAADFFAHFKQEPAGKGLQRQIMHEILQYQKDTLIDSLRENKTELVRWTGIMAESAGLWITTAPTHAMFKLTDEQFRTAARIRLGLVPHDNLRFCICGTSLISNPYHFYSCRQLLPSNTHRHNIILYTIVKIAKLLSIPTEAEPVVDYIDGARTDARFELHERSTMIDVSVIHPMADSYLSAARRSLGAAEIREKEKRAEYGERARLASCLFFPFVMETTGGIGQQAEKFITQVCDDVYGGGIQAPIPGSVRGFIRKAVEIALCIGNGLVREVGIRRAREFGRH